MKDFLKDFLYVFGLGVMILYYGLTCYIYILAFIYGKSSVTIYLNNYGEFYAEFIVSIISIPCVIYVLKNIYEDKRVKP